jgi:transposase
MIFIGCDVSKATLDAAWFNPASDAWVEKLKLTNSAQGWNSLLKQVRNGSTEADDLCLVIEATGVYHRPLADRAHRDGVRVIIANPGRVAEYASSRNRLEKCAFIAQSQELARSIGRQLSRLDKERQLIQNKIDELINTDSLLRQTQELLQSIKGLGKLTSQWLLPLLRPKRFDSARQLAAFMGLTPIHRTSGTSLNKAGRLSGRGDPYLRSRLYLPALCAKRHDPVMAAFYERLIRRGKTPKQALSAIMRKLIHVAFGVVKNKTPYQCPLPA